MPETQLDRLERLIEKLTSDVGDLKSLSHHESEMMKITRGDLASIFGRLNAIDKDLSALKTKATFFGTIGGTLAGIIAGTFTDLIRRP